MKTTAVRVTPLLTLMRACTVDEQYELARLAGTKRNYLYQLASCNRKRIGADLAMAICAASEAMSASTNGRTPVITMEEITTMCTTAQEY